MSAGRQHVLQRDAFPYVSVLLTTMVFIGLAFLLVQSGSIETINSSGLLGGG